jgi:hypothetical protein
MSLYPLYQPSINRQCHISSQKINHIKCSNVAGFETVTAVVMKTSVFRVISPCCTMKVKTLRNQHEADFLLDVLSELEDGDDVRLRNVI